MLFLHFFCRANLNQNFSNCEQYGSSPYFGWSAGDIAQAIRILVKMHDAFNETKGASMKFAEATRFLGGSSVNLTHLQD
jgi:hypothetical protein